MIEEHLAQMDEFRPAGSIRSEIELDFPEFGDPFAEEFVEEEIVIERYRSDVEMFAALPRVASLQGQQLAAILDRAPEGISQPISTTVIAEATAIDAVGGSDVTFSATVPAAAQQIAKADVSAARALVTERLDTALAEELVVVEDEPAGPLWLRPSKRKLEYARLFAKLRRP